MQTARTFCTRWHGIWNKAAFRRYTGATRSSKTIFSGIQPTGIPHIGNYIGALQNWVKLQDSAGPDDRVIFSIVDLHAITIPQKPADLRRQKQEMLASLLAIGLNPDKCILYEQSTVPEHTELSWILSTMAPLGALNRMTQFRSKAKVSTENMQATASLDGLMLGLFAYPVLQAADILLYKTTLVPVGKDQSQHLELSRTLAKSINGKMGKRVFPLPETLLSNVGARVNDLREPTKKMSKSAVNEKSRISIIDPEEMIRKKIAGAMTDSVDGVTYDPVTRPGVSNLLDIYACFTSHRHVSEDMLRDVGNLSHQGLKQLVADSIVDGLAPIRERYRALDFDTHSGKQKLADIRARGTGKARKIAQETMTEVRQLIGLI